MGASTCSPKAGTITRTVTRHLWSGNFDHRATLAAFDLLELNGTDYRSRPFIERKKRLAKLLAKDRLGIEYVDHLTGDGAIIFEHGLQAWA